ncbi:MAG: hypothetical protein EOP04_01930 [Proteobacteria bacterium]|nr:MAG: hypothetical protein EOP04_01930 [Pseudomonadota bacterium]
MTLKSNKKYFKNERTRNGRALGHWIGGLAYLPAKAEGYTIVELAEFLDVPKRTLHDFFKDFIQPTEEILIGKQWNFAYAQTTLKDLGKQFLAASLKGDEVFKNI